MGGRWEENWDPSGALFREDGTRAANDVILSTTDEYDYR